MYIVYMCVDRESCMILCGGLVEDKVEQGVSSLGMCACVCVCWGHPAA